MNINDGYDLKYVCKTTNKIYDVKRIIPGHYSIREPLTGISRRIKRSELMRLYEFQERISMESVRQRSQPIILNYA